jgi:hypothetical protein
MTIYRSAWRHIPEYYNPQIIGYVDRAYLAQAPYVDKEKDNKILGSINTGSLIILIFFQWLYSPLGA